MGLNVLSSLTAAAVTLSAVLAVAPAAAEHHEAAGPTAEAALAKLMEGNARFVAGEMQHPNLSAERRAELAKGQSPYAVIVSCSDSRVPPEHVFDAGPGDLFVIRVAGNVAGDDALASIEYAVAKLHSPLVLVMGHENCGAVGAAVATETEGAEFGGSIHDLVETIRPAVKEALAHGHVDNVLEGSIQHNAEAVAAQLLDAKPYISAAAEAGKVTILAGRYDLDSGAVSLYHQGDDHASHDHALNPEHAHDHAEKAACCSSPKCCS